MLNPAPSTIAPGSSAEDTVKGDPMEPMIPSNMNANDRHVCISTSFNSNNARLFLFDGDKCLGNELLAGRGQDELGECLGQGMRLLLGQK
jgi:hypothetical protein